jgi:hypothetical protein
MRRHGLMPAHCLCTRHVHATATGASRFSLRAELLLHGGAAIDVECRGRPAGPHIIAALGTNTDWGVDIETQNMRFPR